MLAKTSQMFGDIQNYLGQRRTYTPLLDDGQSLPAENKPLPGTVEEDLNILFEELGKWYDASIQKEITNQGTMADVEIEGKVILAGLPATALLNLESKLAELGNVLKSIPVTNTDVLWSYDDQEEAYLSEPRTTFRTEKQTGVTVLYEATKEHPAQVETYSQDDRVGEWTTVILSGAYQPAEYRALISRWEKLFRAVKRARQRANDIEAADKHVAETIFSFLRG